MTESEATEAVQYLANLYPRTNNDTLDYWRMKFLKYEQEIVHRAVIKFYDTDKSGFVDKSGLLAQLDTESGRVPVQASAKDRFEAEKRDAAARRRAEEIEMQKSKQSFSAIDDALKGLTDEEIAILKAKTVADASDDLARFIRNSDPKTGKVLRYHMAKKLRGAARGGDVRNV